MFDFVAKVFRRSAFAFGSDDQDIVPLRFTEFEQAQDRVGDSIYLGQEGLGHNCDSHTRRLGGAHNWVGKAR
jgi:hypothetical protein